MRLSGRMIVALLAVAAGLVAPVAALAQTMDQPQTVNVVVLPLHISGQYGATTTAVARLQMPFACMLSSAQASARASGGISPTLAVDVRKAGASVLAAPIAVAAGTVSFGSIASASIADETALTVDLTIGGTLPTWHDITVVLVCLR